MKELLISSVLFLLPAAFIERIAHIDTRTVSGKVVGFDDSLPIEGVTVAVRGAHTTTGTQADGTFYIRVHTPQDSVLVFRATGYQTQEVKLTSRLDYDVALSRR